MKFAALLRGINVGKSVQVPMKTLKALLEGLGLKSVLTYLNSGNVLFDATQNSEQLQTEIEKVLADRFGQNIPVLVKSSEDITRIRDSIPNDWQNNENEQTYIAYLFKDAANPDIISELPIRKEYLTIKYAHESVIWNIKRENYNKSQINKIVNHKSYLRMTIRNVNTARKLAELCKGD